MKKHLQLAASEAGAGQKMAKRTFQGWGMAVAAQPAKTGVCKMLNEGSGPRFIAASASAVVVRGYCE